MNDIFFIGFIIFFVITLIVIIGVYKIISLWLYKRRYKDKGMKILRIFTVIAVIIFMMISAKAGVWLYEHPRIKDPNYVSSTYSIVVYNATGVTIKSIDVFVGDNRILMDTIYDISPKEYRKINISTQEGELIDSITPPYNVYITEAENTYAELCVGYFGIRTGGFELVNIISNESNKITFEKEKHSSNEYIKALRLDRKNQGLLSWY